MKLITLLLVVLGGKTTFSAEESDFAAGAPTTLVVGALQLTLSSRLLLDLHSPRSATLKGYLGWAPTPTNSSYASCSGAEGGSICLQYAKNTKLLLVPEHPCQEEEEASSCGSASCYQVLWENHVGGTMDCFVLGEDHWYGGGQVLVQRWPIQDERPWYATVTGDPLHHPSGNVVENLWLSSSGFLIRVEPRVPLFVNFNESGSGKMCLTTSKKYPYHHVAKSKKSQVLSYSLCAAATVKEAHAYALQRWVEKPRDVPDEAIVRRPIWSSWVRYRRRVDQNAILAFASEIESSRLPASLLEIDDKWESCYGDLTFDPEKFPAPKQMVGILRERGLATSLWVHPFCNVDCECYAVGKEKGFWVKTASGQREVARVKWWNGVAALLDVTNPEAVQWFVARLKRVQNAYDVAAFKFDAGEVSWMVSEFAFYDGSANLQPNTYSRCYAKMAGQFGRAVEVRVGYETQGQPHFVRMFDKYSNWDYANGLKTLIPAAFQLSLLGYLFVLPDMVGGNSYDGSLPDRELYVRWIEASVFMAAVQFSIAPWDYDDEVTQIAAKMLRLREKYAGYILDSALQAASTGHPLIRPLWWLDPDDPEVLAMDSQFLVGKGLMVAPVLEKGRRERHVYLPEGTWADVQRGKTYEGSRWLYDYSTPLNFLPFFVKQS